ncbi:monoheme cytochrome C [Sediminicola luteus]|uniref:Monoheme cytochrome C n=1 Tax=Sediminicola luteus TaxID=319238 RepID=A0A2A4GDX4_9FLAO|nr:monoheme cytochrome C [Sediminicola luteus]PCE65995.1 hypothetical protein B7P33_01450 [Sediminicola luteus]
MENPLQSLLQKLYGLLLGFFAILIAAGALLVYVATSPDPFGMNTPEVVIAETETEEVVDPDLIENGVHVASGLVEGEGLMTVVQNCTSCHSGKLVSQNRMNREAWKHTIEWMQETQGLWDLGNNEVIILDYLSEYYAPVHHGRRQNLTDVAWYDLE